MHSFQINRYKAEAPVMATFFLFALICSLYFYPSLYWFAFLIFPLLFVAYVLLRMAKFGFFKRQTFFVMDEEGIKWDLVDKVNYQMYETNFKLKESGEIISMNMGYFQNPDDIVEIKRIISSHCQEM
jgi:hypothetical protein